jgi:hypothetical protein
VELVGPAAAAAAARAHRPQRKRPSQGRQLRGGPGARGRTLKSNEGGTDNVAVRGYPWDMSVSIEWVDRATAVDGEAYVNEGAHWIRLQRGKATRIHAFLDTEKVTQACERLAAAGFEEAGREPITA